MNNMDTTFAAVTTWIAIADAKAKRAELIAQGLDKKQIKLSSYRWKNIKNHDEGYICRVLVVKGLRPELELADTKRVAASRERVATNRKAFASFATDCNTASSATDSQTMTYFCRRNSINETFTA